MKTIKFKAGDETTELYRELCQTLEEGGLVCVPCNGSYRIMAALTSPEAVMHLIQSKRRVHHAPALVFVDGLPMLFEVADSVDVVAKKLAKALWPGPLTIQFQAHRDLPRDVVKQLVKANGKIGVRVPDDDFCRELVERFGGPLLVSSANKGKKQGASSPAQVRKNFVSRVDIFVDAGDLPPRPSSTVIAIEDGEVNIQRAGAIDEEAIEQAIA